MSTQIQYSYNNFGPFLFKTKLPVDLISKLLDEGNKSKLSANDKLAGHIDNQFHYSQDFRKWFYNEMSSYFGIYRQEHCKFHGLQNLPIELEGLNLWINYMQAGDYNPLHSHGGDYSFVIYLDVPDEIHEEASNFEGTDMKPGAIKFVFTQESSPRWATTDVRHIPKTGDMFIFPALLMHYVAPFKSNVTRISVSGNIRIANRSSLPDNYF